jgi:mono/diheme cytochrome c family protein
MLSAALPAALAVLLTAQGCGKKESGPAGETTAPQVAAAPALSAEPAPAVAAAPAAEAPAATTTAATTTAATDTDAGAKVFQSYCLTCHGPAGKGDGIAAAALNPKPANFAAGAFKYDVNGNGTKGDIDDIKAIVHDGAAKHGGSPLMAPWPMLSPDQLQAVATYVKSLRTS